MSVNDVQYSTINIISACVAKAGTQSEYVFFEGLYSLYSDGLPLQINEEINRRPPKVFPAIKKRAGGGARKFLNNEFTILPMPPGSGSGSARVAVRKKNAIFLLFLPPCYAIMSARHIASQRGEE